MDSSSSNKQQAKRKRGRPRKNNEKTESKSEVKHNKKDENIILFLALSDDDDTSDSGEDNRFTINDSEPKTGKVIQALTDEESDASDDTFNTINNIHLDVATLIEEIRRRDVIIDRLKSKGSSFFSSYNTTRPTTINYHCVQVAHADTGKIFVPELTDADCWWCDHGFDDLPVYLVNYYRNGTHYIFGNFCSFNCALKYNIKMLKDFKCGTRHALTLNLRMKITGETGSVKLADDRETLQSKGGTKSIDFFRHGFSIVSVEMRLNMPPMIPLMHVIEECRRD